MLRTAKWNDNCKRSLQLLENIFTIHYVISFLSMSVRRHYVICRWIYQSGSAAAQWGKMPEPSPTERRQTGTKTLHKLRLIETTENLPINVIQPYIRAYSTPRKRNIPQNPLYASCLPLLAGTHILLSLIFQFGQPILVSESDLTYNFPPKTLHNSSAPTHLSSPLSEPAQIYLYFFN